MIKAITGTKDILPSDIQKWYFLEENIRKVFKLFNYGEIRTPIFEETALFSRSLGEETDIVSKEMYSFRDRSDTSITLKPEMTAGVVRAYIEHALGSKQGLNKLFYISPMFRQERPQAGRLRQFHQFGAEALGSYSPLLDAEMIIIAYNILTTIGLKDITVKINSLGIPSCREEYKIELREFLKEKLQFLSEESKKRFSTNVLRIFDSKDENDIEVLSNAPILSDYLDEKSKNDFLDVQNSLNDMKIPFVIDYSLVRGLDYYTKTTFEIISGKVGSQNALCGGGRYDSLVEELGGKQTPGVGFAAGMERILLALVNEKKDLNLTDEIEIYIIRIDDTLKYKVFEIASKLREKNISTEMDYLDRSVKAQMREANKMNAKYVLFIGGEEYKANKVLLKNMKNGEQKQISLDDLIIELNKIEYWS
jgi:histidyl-tRNA synthetase